MKYLGMAVEVLFVIFVVYSVNKAITKKDPLQIQRITNAFVWMGVFATVIFISQIAEMANIVTSGIHLEGLDILTLWGFSYIAAWLLNPRSKLVESH